MSVENATFVVTNILREAKPPRSHYVAFLLPFHIISIPVKVSLLDVNGSQSVWPSKGVGRIDVNGIFLFLAYHEGRYINNRITTNKMRNTTSKARALQHPVCTLTAMVKEINGGSLVDQIDGLEEYQAVKHRINDIFLTYLLFTDGQELQDHLKLDVFLLFNAFHGIIDTLYSERATPIQEINLKNQIAN